jgi:diadenylate cyclase
MIFSQLPLHTIIINIIFAFIDILICSYIFYKFYQILAQTKAVQVIKGLFFFVILYILSRLFNLETFSWLLNQIASVVVIAVIILFQPELRRVLTKLGQSTWITNFIKKDPKDLSSIISAVQNFQILHIGALVVFERNVGLRNIIETGTVLNAKISTSLLLTLFTYKTPLHDGAVIIKNDSIIAAGCFLPLSDSKTISKDYGTRHRAALGLAEESDALVIIVSEETGKIGLAYDGRLYSDFSIDALKTELFNQLGYEEESARGYEE